LIGLGCRKADRQRVKVRGHVRRTITDEPPDANERNASSGNPILLQCAAGAFGDLLYVMIRKQVVEHRYLLGMRRNGAPQEVARYNFQK
jgi:hypothetical protein